MPELLPQLSELTALRKSIGERTLSGPPVQDPVALEAHKHALAELRSRKEDLEQRIAAQLPSATQASALEQVTCGGVASALPQGSTLVEIIRLDQMEVRRGERWVAVPARLVAVVLRGKALRSLKVVDLGAAEAVAEAVASWRSRVTGEGRGERSWSDRIGGARTRKDELRDVVREHSEGAASDQESGERVRALVFDPLLPFLRKQKRLIIAPDGELATFPFQALPYSGKQRLIHEYDITYVTSGRDLLDEAISTARASAGPIVATDPDYDLGTTHLSGNEQPGQLTFRRLRGTIAEGEAVARRLGVQQWIQGDVREGRLKACQSPRMLHLATHGFFFQNPLRDPDSPTGIQVHFVTVGAGSERTLTRQSLETINDPLLRSGLVLAGVNACLRGVPVPDEIEDGILTSDDVAALDLAGTEMVVLSACETGLGEVRNGEGVFGLRRAFALAGARSLVLSLWKVPDKATRVLMEREAGMPRSAALREAQLSMADRPPVEWGAFILQGDAGPLPLHGESN